MQAVIGNEQMKKLEWRVERKKEIYKLYKSLLNPVTEVSFFDQDLEFTTPWFIDVLVEKRDELQIHLKERSIGTRIMYPPVNKQAAYNIPGNFEVSNIIGMKGLWLPSAAQLTNQSIEYICKSIIDFYAIKL
jgi:perosamine synthetase